jgi:hypothetical protein
MKLKIRRNDGDPRDVKVLREAVPFMLNRLLKPAHVKKVVIHITLTRLHGDFGDIGIETAPTFRIRLHHEMDTLVMILTLAHELVHMSQVMHGRLQLKKINDLLEWCWDGKPYGTAPYDVPNLVLPWESDADERESDLACQFFQHYVTLLNG